MGKLNTNQIIVFVVGLLVSGLLFFGVITPDAADAANQVIADGISADGGIIAFILTLAAVLLGGGKKE